VLAGVILSYLDNTTLVLFKCWQLTAVAILLCFSILNLLLCPLYKHCMLVLVFLLPTVFLFWQLIKQVGIVKRAAQRLSLFILFWQLG
jgi:hypothetical protein